jgi:hypothetical protein
MQAVIENAIGTTSLPGVAVTAKPATTRRPQHGSRALPRGNAVSGCCSGTASGPRRNCVDSPRQRRRRCLYGGQRWEISLVPRDCETGLPHRGISPARPHRFCHRFVPFWHLSRDTRGHRFDWMNRQTARRNIFDLVLLPDRHYVAVGQGLKKRNHIVDLCVCPRWGRPLPSRQRLIRHVDIAT